jgi:Na+-translocating ferredoxin:NAD+ oxidoreductase subunit B
MQQNSKAYRKLQKHLDKQAVGFPATRKGVEIQILKHIFTPQEAEIALYISYKAEPVKVIFEKVGHLVQSADELESLLDGLGKKGGIEIRLKNGEKVYCCAPLVVGMYEFQTKRLTREFVKNFNAYTNTMHFGVAFMSTKLPQMRTIPIARSVKPRYHVSTFDELSDILKQSEGPFNIVECICRAKRSIEGEPCKVTQRKETCLGMGDLAHMFLDNGIGRMIARDEALSILEQNQKEGMVLQPSNTKKADFICSCCGCCCGMLEFQKRIPKPIDYWASNYYAKVDATCEGCGVCETRCQVGAVRVSTEEMTANIDLDRCIGCGLCVTSCPNHSIELVKKPIETMPPQSREELFDIIMAHKKGPLGKLKVVGKIAFDALRTGQMHLLKP